MRETARSMLVSMVWSMLSSVRLIVCFSCFYSFVTFPFSLAILAEAFPDSAVAATATVEECRAEYHIVCHENPKAELSIV
jgi:hypothetical protein